MAINDLIWADSGVIYKQCCNLTGRYADIKHVLPGYNTKNSRQRPGPDKEGGVRGILLRNGGGALTQRENASESAHFIPARPFCTAVG